MCKTELNDLINIKIRNDIANLLTKINAENICEIGVRYGDHFTKLLLPNIKKAVAVDVWKETGTRSQNDVCASQQELDRQYQSILDLSKKNPIVQVVRDFSVNASKLFDDNYFDFVYIDADHTEASVYADICAWYPKVRVGGVLSGHDYSPAIPTTLDNVVLKFGVIEAVNRFVRENKLVLHVDNEQSWFIIKS